jgi:hypothetical protein
LSQFHLNSILAALAAQRTPFQKGEAFLLTQQKMFFREYIVGEALLSFIENNYKQGSKEPTVQEANTHKNKTGISITNPTRIEPGIESL